MRFECFCFFFLAISNYRFPIFNECPNCNVSSKTQIRIPFGSLIHCHRLWRDPAMAGKIYCKLEIENYFLLIPALTSSRNSG